MKECVLRDGPCTNCGECDRCDLNPNKICDNCGLCIDSAEDYNILKIDEIQIPDDLKNKKIPE